MAIVKISSATIKPETVGTRDPFEQDHQLDLCQDVMPIRLHVNSDREDLHLDYLGVKPYETKARKTSTAPTNVQRVGD